MTLRWNRSTALSFCLLAATSAALAVSCPVLHTGLSSAGEGAFLHADYEKATELYKKTLTEKPDDPETTAAFSRVLLRQQKYNEAGYLIVHAEAAYPHNAALEAAQATVELRAGKPWAAITTGLAALRDNPCEPQAHRIIAELQRLNSNYASEKREIDIAHQLSPDDLDIRRDWILTLPMEQRVMELKSYLSGANGEDAEDRAADQKYLEQLQSRLSYPHKKCHSVSTTAAAVIPFYPLTYDGHSDNAFALDVKLNDQASRLKIDTGVAGIHIIRALAERAHLNRLPEVQNSGVRDRGPLAGYTAFADNLRIGGLEFRDCLVEVTDRNDVFHSDGLIGLDVFSNFLVGVDYPKSQLTLGPLPALPDDDKTGRPTLNTDQAGGSRGSDYLAGQDVTSPSPGVHPMRHDRYVSPEMKSYSGFYREGHQILMPTKLNDQSQRLFLLDTGSSTTTISADAARGVTQLSPDRDTQILGSPGKENKAFTAKKIKVEFAGIRQENDDIHAFDMSNFSKYSGTEISGELGFTTLKLLIIHIDYRDGLIKFDYDTKH